MGELITSVAWAGTHVGFRRESNQDAWCCDAAAGVFVVADGLGGRPNGEVASAMAVATIARTCRSAREDGGGGGDVLLHAFNAANAAIVAANAEDPCVQLDPHATMGTTAVALRFFGDGRAYWGHVGDSRLYRLRREELELLTADHTPFGEALGALRPVPPGLPHAGQLLRVLGLHESVEPSFGDDLLQAGDTFLLCSDGVHGALSPEELRRELMRADVAAAGADLLERALDAGGHDNATVVLARYVGA